VGEIRAVTTWTRITLALFFVLLLISGQVPNLYVVGFFYVSGCAVILVYRFLRWFSPLLLRIRPPRLPHPKPWPRQRMVSDDRLKSVLHDIKNSGLAEDQKRTLQEEAMRLFLDRMHGG
jgi:hypothetical protein